MRKLALLTIPLTLLLFVGLFTSCSAFQRPLTLEEKAQDLYRSLMCPLCAGQTLEQSQSEISNQMRALVREKLEQGATKEEIMQFFVERYGEAVLAAPAKKGFSLFVWIIPALAMVVGGFFLYRLIKAMQARATVKVKPESQLSEQERQYWDKRLKAELEERDGEIH